MNEQKNCIDGPIYGARKRWLKERGAIPVGMLVCHKCDNPRCQNFKHLFLGTPKDNTRDMLRKGRHWVRKGKEHYKAKLSEADLIAIKAEYKFRGKKGNDGKSLAVKYGVTQQTITRIARGKERV